jgi:hypothetical protein
LSFTTDEEMRIAILRFLGFGKTSLDEIVLKYGEKKTGFLLSSTKRESPYPSHIIKRAVIKKFGKNILIDKVTQLRRDNFTISDI